MQRDVGHWRCRILCSFPRYTEGGRGQRRNHMESMEGTSLTDISALLYYSSSYRVCLQTPIVLFLAITLDLIILILKAKPDD
jgi:hypothetical protein